MKTIKWKKSKHIEEKTGHSHYEVSNTGEVRNTKNGRILKQASQFIYRWKKKYMQVYVTDTTNKTHSFRVHRLVALAFIPNPDNLETVDHIDFDPTNNHVDNLQWLSRYDNNHKRKSRTIKLKNESI